MRGGRFKQFGHWSWNFLCVGKGGKTFDLPPHPHFNIIGRHCVFAEETDTQIKISMDRDINIAGWAVIIERMRGNESIGQEHGL